jgi:hypothetical protein
MAGEGSRREPWFGREWLDGVDGDQPNHALFGLGDMLVGGSTFALGETVMFNRLTGTTWDALQAAEAGAAKLIDYQDVNQALVVTPHTGRSHESPRSRSAC